MPRFKVGRRAPVPNTVRFASPRPAAWCFARGFSRRCAASCLPYALGSVSFVKELTLTGGKNLDVIRPDDPESAAIRWNEVEEYSRSPRAFPHWIGPRGASRPPFWPRTKFGALRCVRGPTRHSPPLHARPRARPSPPRLRLSLSLRLSRRVADVQPPCRTRRVPCFGPRRSQSIYLNLY